MRFTIGYIEHDSEVFDKYLGKSINELIGDFDIIYTSSDKYPAENYNYIIGKSNNDWIILTHQDISFSKDILYKIENTMKVLDDKNIKYSALGLVGIDINTDDYRWSNCDEIYELETCDCCFIVINKQNLIFFDSELFDDFHLYVEDFCIQSKKIGGVYTILGIESFDSLGMEEVQIHKSHIIHHSQTVKKRGFAWGRYLEYKEILNNKWGRKIKTT